MARMWICFLLAGLLLMPVASVGGVKRTERTKTAVAPKHGRTKWRPPENKQETRYQRGKKARQEFQRANPCPSTGKRSGRCPGYVVDHVRPLKRGGPDVPSNMQWQQTK